MMAAAVKKINLILLLYYTQHSSPETALEAAILEAIGQKRKKKITIVKTNTSESDFVNLLL